MLGLICMRERITEGHDQCDARSDRRRPCIRGRASRVGGGVAVMKCGLAGRPSAFVIYCLSSAFSLFAPRPQHGDAERRARTFAHVLETYLSRFRNHKHGWWW